jgi:hypothetical protein
VNFGIVGQITVGLQVYPIFTSGKVRKHGIAGGIGQHAIA